MENQNSPLQNQNAQNGAKRQDTGAAANPFIEKEPQIEIKPRIDPPPQSQIEREPHQYQRRPIYTNQIGQTHYLKKTIKFAVLALFAAFSVLIANHYYYLKDYSLNLSNDISVIVFIDKASKDDAAVCDAIEALGLATIDDYVNSKDVYAKAVEENPFLKDIVVPGTENSFQSYVKLSPKELPTDDYMADLRNELYKIANIDDVVFDVSLFKQYAKIKSSVEFYRFAIMIFAAVIFTLLLLRIFISAALREERVRVFIYHLAAYMLSATAGFLIIWTVCLFYNYSLTISQEAIFIIIPLTASLGILYKD
ncbi:MAG: hypothetical protein LBV16_08900 [Elusimicrobiota bacterium]|nr:hypothetical protein [Elusimicrobiota bacterium]